MVYYSHQLSSVAYFVYDFNVRKLISKNLYWQNFQIPDLSIRLLQQQVTIYSKHEYEMIMQIYNEFEKTNFYKKNRYKIILR